MKLSFSTSNASPLDKPLAHGLARLGLGLCIALHGYVRLPHLANFADELQKEFANTFLPPALTHLTAEGIVIAEAIIGTFLLLGLFLRAALVAGSALMILLLFGVCLLQKWEVAGLQLTYLAIYAALLFTAEWDRFSIDHWRRNRR